jgi:hypothetical protein
MGNGTLCFDKLESRPGVHHPNSGAHRLQHADGATNVFLSALSARADLDVPPPAPSCCVGTARSTTNRGVALLHRSS